jgi:hypothetical protein
MSCPKRRTLMKKQLNAIKYEEMPKIPKIEEEPKISDLEHESRLKMLKEIGLIKENGTK